MMDIALMKLREWMEKNWGRIETTIFVARV
jgi:hypothetical protein